MRYCVSEITEVLLQAFGAVDLQERGIVGADVVRRVLDNFCFIMTNKQFNVGSTFGEMLFKVHPKAAQLGTFYCN